MRNGPPLDVELEKAVRYVPSGDYSMRPATIPALRRAMRDQFATDAEIVEAAPVSVEHRVAVSPKGGGVPLIIVRPIDQSEPTPWIYHVHGGGLVAGGHRSGLATMATLAAETNSVVVSVEYRLAPEHPYPAAVDDCLDGLEWLVGSASDLGIDPKQLIVMGGSAGGGIAAGMALRCRDEHGPTILSLVLVQPMLDDRNESPSSYEMDGDFLWDRTSNATAWAAYLGSLSEVPAYAAPARAEHLEDMPATYLEIGGVDIFRDECLQFAQALSQARVPVELHLWPGGFHGFDAHDTQLSRQALAVRTQYIRRILGQS